MEVMEMTRPPGVKHLGEERREEEEDEKKSSPRAPEGLSE